MSGQAARAGAVVREGEGARRLLIVNADDYGLTAGISKGILEASDRGIVTSTSVLAVGPAFEETGAWLADKGDELAAGVHLALVGEDPPLLSRREIPSLTDRRGRFPLKWRGFLLRAAAGRIDPADVERELSAQIQKVRTLGLPLHHLDTHQHLHLWPLVSAVVLSLAARESIPCVRVPRSHRSGGRGFSGFFVRRLGKALARDARAAGLRFPAAMAGFDEAGRLDQPTLEAAVSRLAATEAATCELCVHPGAADDPHRARYRWGYRWADELEALTAPATRRAVEAAGFRLGSYAELARA